MRNKIEKNLWFGKQQHFESDLKQRCLWSGIGVDLLIKPATTEHDNNRNNVEVGNAETQKRLQALHVSGTTV